MAKLVIYPEHVTDLLLDIGNAMQMARSAADVNALATLLRLKFDVMQGEFDINFTRKEKAA
jgi:hypothetical protein